MVVATHETGAVTTKRDAAQVRAMFDRIAPGYDHANSVLSLGRDRAWRRRAPDAPAFTPAGRALDDAGGGEQLGTVTDGGDRFP